MLAASTDQMTEAPGTRLRGLRHPHAGGIATSSALTLARPHSPLITHPCPALQLGIVRRLTVAASGEEEHPGTDQLIANALARI
jgi:hypothetical protein